MEEQPNLTNEIFRQAMESDEKLPIRVREEILGTVNVLKSFSEILELFVTKAIDTAITNVSAIEMGDSED
ncbi:MAG: hypothetical protein ACKVTZ_09045 [Bacteroidia bacterium]